MKEVFLLPLKIIWYPFKFVGEIIREIREEEEIKGRERLRTNFKKSLTEEDLSLIQEEFILESYLNDIIEQISLYKGIKDGRIHKGYLKPEVLVSAHGNNSLYIIKPEKIEELRKKLG